MKSYDKKIIEEFSRDHDINVYELLEMYQRGDSRKEIAEALNITEYLVRHICEVLQLRMKSKHRKSDYLALKTRLDNDDSATKVELDRIEAENQLLRTELKGKQKQLIKKQDELTALRKIQRDDARTEMMWELIEKKAAENFPDINIPKVEVSKDVKTDWGMCLMWADLHLGLEMSQEECGNEYNLEEFNRRMENGTKDFLSKTQLSKNLHVYLLGDLFEGNSMKYDQLISAELDLFEQIDELIAAIIKNLVMLLSKYEKIKLRSVVGNHSRVQEKAHFAKKYLNFETFLFRELKGIIRYNEALKGRVEIDWHPSTYYMEEINGSQVLSLHGDSFKTVNDSNINNLADYAKRIFGVKPDIIIYGHFHRFSVSDIGEYEVIACRSLKGIDAYYTMNNFKPNLAGVTGGYINSGVKEIYNMKVL